MTSSFNIPQKSSFSGQEVCSTVGIKPYVLRFWEAEFEQVKSISSSSGQKMYSYEIVEVIFHIKNLLFEDKLTIEQAKPSLLERMEKSESLSVKTFTQSTAVDISEVKAMLSSLSSRLNDVQSQYNWH